MLDHKEFEADHLTPILVTSLMGVLLALLLLSGLHSRLIELGCLKKDPVPPGNEMLLQGQQRNQQCNNDTSGLGNHHSVQSLSSQSSPRLLPEFVGSGDDGSAMLAVTSALAADAIS